jgi:hypothetical protein
MLSFLPLLGSRKSREEAKEKQPKHANDQSAIHKHNKKYGEHSLTLHKIILLHTQGLRTKHPLGLFPFALLVSPSLKSL